MEIRNVTDIIVHCSATPEGRNVQLKDIDRMHKERGFNKVGYHFIVLLDGTIEIGRNLTEQGAHVSGHNENTIGVCYIGGMDENNKKAKDTRTNHQKVSLFYLLNVLKKITKNAKISGHRDFSKDLNKDGVITPNEYMKECPCFDAINEYKNI